jgi:hypothetical protein
MTPTMTKTEARDLLAMTTEGGLDAAIYPTPQARVARKRALRKMLRRWIDCTLCCPYHNEGGNAFTACHDSRTFCKCETVVEAHCVKCGAEVT